MMILKSTYQLIKLKIYFHLVCTALFCCSSILDVNVYADQGNARAEATNLMKKHENIGIPFKPNTKEQKSITNYKKKERQRQQLLSLQSQIISSQNEEIVQEMNEDSMQFVWTDELMDIAFTYLIEIDILNKQFIYRPNIAQKIIDVKLSFLDARFIILKPSTYLSTFYKKHNEIMKSKDQGTLNQDELLPYQQKLLSYIEHTGITDAIVHAHSDMS